MAISDAEIAEDGGSSSRRKPTEFLVVLSPQVAEGVTVEAATRDQARSRAAKALAAHPDYGVAMQGDGLVFEVVPRKGWEPGEWTVEMQPAPRRK